MYLRKCQPISSSSMMQSKTATAMPSMRLSRIRLCLLFLSQLTYSSTFSIILGDDGDDDTVMCNFISMVKEYLTGIWFYIFSYCL